MTAKLTTLVFFAVLVGCGQPTEYSHGKSNQAVASVDGENQDIVLASRALWMREVGMTAERFDGAYRYVTKDRGEGVCVEWYLYNGDIGGDGIYCFDKATRELRFQRLGE